MINERLITISTLCQPNVLSETDLPLLITVAKTSFVGTLCYKKHILNLTEKSNISNGRPVCDSIKVTFADTEVIIDCKILTSR